ncbi:SMR family transporter [Stenomitos frigidus]|uniref:Small multidrug resistance protein n=1 Tax=Stenomitos frigidus ULC18 TaxID=2107698 RepID=A0A2T1E599_9CYAN|nr:SMR family transporter [Stenomitos frigidus]PSB27908.1 small multidrug resistance protein [Stenomitos frigidus ULC18]
MFAQLVFALLILTSVGLNTLGQTLLKLGSGQNPLNLYLLGGITAYALSTIFYVLVLGKVNLSIAYPFVIGLTMIATTICGAVILREKIFTLHWIGLGLMLSGLSAIALAKASSS